MDKEKLHHLIQEALKEDIGSGDHSTLSSIPPNEIGKAILKIKEDGILAGMAVAQAILDFTETEVKITPYMHDGDSMQSGDHAFEVEAKMQTILSCERLILNCMQRMSGIATLTNTYTKVLQNYHTKVLDTRKTTPNFRLLEKEAVRIGGGNNHRFGLFDMIMLKDNHIDFCGGLKLAIDKAFDYVQKKDLNLKIEVETRNLDDVRTVLAVGKGKVARIMFDNFTPDIIREAMQILGGEFETEASGGINLETVEDYAKTGVDFVSVGGLIHQARSLDMSLKVQLV